MQCGKYLLSRPSVRSLFSTGCRGIHSLPPKCSRPVSTTVQQCYASDSKTLFEDLGAEVDGPNFRVGSPGPTELAQCAKLLERAATWKMSQTNVESLFHYGPQKGDPGFRRALARFLTTRYEDEVLPENIIPTAGATQGIAMLTSFFFSAGDVVFVEDLTFFIALDFFRKELDLKIVGVPSDENGIIPSELERLVNTHMPSLRVPTDERPFSAMLYCIPTYHNPTGRCLSHDRRAELVEVAKQYDLLVACDDVYNLLPVSLHSNRPVTVTQRLLSYDNVAPGDTSSGNIVSNGTFSKIFGPGFRLGWLEGPDRILEPLRKSSFIRGGGAVQHVVAGIAEGLISLGLLGEHVDHCRTVFECRARVLHRALTKHMPLGVSWRFPEGGFFIWVQLPDDVDGDDLEKSVLEEKVLIFSGKHFSADGRHRNYIRLCFTYSSEDLLEKGAEILGRHIRKLSSSCGDK